MKPKIHGNKVEIDLTGVSFDLREVPVPIVVGGLELKMNNTNGTWSIEATGPEKINPHEFLNGSDSCAYYKGEILVIDQTSVLRIIGTFRAVIEKQDSNVTGIIDAELFNSGNFFNNYRLEIDVSSNGEISSIKPALATNLRDPMGPVTFPIELAGLFHGQPMLPGVCGLFVNPDQSFGGFLGIRQ